MNVEEQKKAAFVIMDHMISSAQYGPSIRNVFVGILRSLARESTIIALEFGESYTEQVYDVRAIRTLVQLHGKSGNFTRPIQLLGSVQNDTWRRDQILRFKTASNILNYGLKLKTTPKKLDNTTKSIIYHASQSLPHSSSGYSIRTHGLVSSLVSKGYPMKVMLRHGYPADRNDFKGNIIRNIEQVDNVEYYFPTAVNRQSSLINYQEVYNFNKLRQYEKQAIESLISMAQKEKPFVIHSASNFVVGLAGAKAAKALGIKSIYEIRGFWHLTQSTKREGYEGSDHYRLSEKFEIETAKESDYVFTITQALKDILVENGVEKTKYLFCLML